MTCKIEKTGDVTMIICGPRGRKPCDSCGKPGSKLCDYPVTRNGARTSCDRKMCEACAHRLPDGTDFCPAHWRIYEKNGMKLVL